MYRVELIENGLCLIFFLVEIYKERGKFVVLETDIEGLMKYSNWDIPLELEKDFFEYNIVEKIK